MDRFYNANDDDINFFIEASTSKNTKKSTNNWVALFSNWAISRGYNPAIEQHPPAELNTILEKFYVELRKTDGKDYEPSSLRVMVAGLDR